MSSKKETISPNRTLRPNLARTFLKELDHPRSVVLRPDNGDWEPGLIHALVEDAAKAKTSDIHIEPHPAGASVRFRIDGVICDVARLTDSQYRLVINQFKAIAKLDPVMSFLPKDAHACCATPEGPLNLRVTVTPCQNGEAMVIRLLDPKRLQHSISELGLARSELGLLETWIESSSGMFVAAGPTGCGKTTTIYALLHELKSADRAIVTLEDPIEYEIEGIVQVQLDHRHRLNFGDGVKEMMRMDPDYLMVGEIRDELSVRAAVDAAISGRVLLSTLHCKDAIGAVTALRNWGLHDHEIVEALSVVVGQRLVRMLCPHCRQKGPPLEKERLWLSTMGLPPPKQVAHATGCQHCSHIGYTGRTGIFELWRLNEADYDMILNHADEHTLRNARAKRNQHTILADGLAKVLDAVTSVAELRRASAGVFPSESLSGVKRKTSPSSRKKELNRATRASAPPTNGLVEVDKITL